MEPTPKKHVSHAIAWSLIALLAGSLAFGIWTYFSQISDIYDNSLTISFSHKKTTTPATTTTTTSTTATTDATADWKTYTNSRVKYSFKYPLTGLTLVLDETIKYPSTSAADAKDEDLVQFATKTNTYGVRTKVGVKETTIEDWIENIDGVDVKDIANYTKTTVGGKTAYTYKSYLITYVMSGSNVYRITDHVGSAPETASDSTYQAWLSTFTFTN